MTGNHKKHGRSPATRRLNIIEGQVRGLKKMVAGGVYCVDILTQASALRQAVSALEDYLLKNHLAVHVAGQIKNRQIEKVKKEFLKIYQLAKKQK